MENMVGFGIVRDYGTTVIVVKFSEDYLCRLNFVCKRGELN